MADDITKETIGKSEAKSKATIALEEKILELQHQQAAKLSERIAIEDELHRKNIEAGEAEVKRITAMAEKSAELLANEELRAELTEKEVEFHERRVKSQAAEIANAEKLLEIERRKRADAEDMGKYTDNLIQRLTGVSDRPSSALGRLVKDPSEFFKRLKGSASKTLTPLNILTSTIDKVAQMTVQMAVEQDAAVVAFNKNTGASGAFDAQIRGLNVDLRFSGVTAAEAGAAYGDLFTQVSDFTLMSEKEQKVLSKTTALLNELGVSSKTTAANIQLATKGLGMSVDQAEYLVRDLNTFARELGLSTEQVAADFSKMAPMITELGTDGVQAFKNLQREAKATGIDINRLYGITSKFDTFDAAAQSVGKLNAMLGGPFLNTMDMVMEEDPAERMRMLKESVDQAGLSFDTMSKFQRKALAEAMGLNDASELALVLRGREDLLPGGEKSAEDIEAMAARTAEFNTIADEFRQTMMAFAIGLGPLVTGFKNFVQLLQPALPLLVAIGVVVAAMFSPFTAIALVISGIVAGLMAITTWWNEGFSPSGKDTFKAMKISTMEVTAATADMNAVQQNGIAGTTAATGMPAATAIAKSNTQAIRSANEPGNVYLDGRIVGEIVNDKVKSPNGAVGELVRRRA